MPTFVLKKGQFALCQKTLTLNNLSMQFVRQGNNAILQIQMTITPDQIAADDADETPISDETGDCGVFTFGLPEFKDGFPDLDITGQDDDSVTIDGDAFSIMTGGVKGEHGVTLGTAAKKK
jgi:hypothetical protein